MCTGYRESLSAQRLKDAAASVTRDNPNRATEAINCSGASLKMEHDSSAKRSKLLTGRN